MKFAFILSALLFSQLSVADAKIRDFTGKFRASSDACPKYEGARVYAATTQDRDGNDLLEIKFYGPDAAIEEILLGSGTRPIPSTTSGGTESWESRIEGNRLFTQVDTDGTNNQFVETYELILQDDGGSMVFTAKSPWRDDQCEMERI